MSHGMETRDMRSASRTLEPLERLQREHSDKIDLLNGQLVVLKRNMERAKEESAQMSSKDYYMVGIIIVFQIILLWWFR